MIRKFAKRIIRILDNHFKTNLFEKALKLEKVWYNSDFLNASRRSKGPAIVKLKYKLGLKDENLLKLHLGCGSRHFEGYINIDLRKTRATNLVCDVRKVPYPDNSVERIETYHVSEHLSNTDAFLQKIKGLFKKEALITTPNRNYYKDPGLYHNQEYSIYEFEELSEKHFISFQAEASEYHLYGWVRNE